MDFFEDEVRSEASSDHSLWPERYRPKDMSTYICDDVVANEVAGFIERGDIPHLLFHGHAGSGKCLDFDEMIDIQITLTDAEYEILKKYNKSSVGEDYNLQIPIGELFKFLKLDDTLYETTQIANRRVKIKTPQQRYVPVNAFVKKRGYVREYLYEDGIEIKCDEKHLVKQRDDSFSFIDDTDHVIVNGNVSRLKNKSPRTYKDVYDISLDRPHEYVTSNGVVCHNTTLAKILASEIPCDLLYVNASDNTGIDFIRDDVKPFAASSGYHALKIVILDESDHLSHSSQAALRNLTETYSKSTRFILTCNFVERLIAPLISRLQVFELEPPSKIDAAMYLKGILDTEDITHTMSDIKSIINDFYPDIRKIVNYSQQVSTTGSIIHIKNQSAAFAVKQSLIKLIVEASKNATVFNDIRQLIADSGTKHFEELYHELYSRLGEYSNNNDLEVIITLAEYSFQNAMVVDKEITFMACISKLISIVK